MKRFLLRIIVVLMVIILLPVSFFILKQLTNLSENEKLVKSVFEKQIETILYSLNQATDNVVSNWVSRLDLPQEADTVVLNEIVNNLIQKNPSIYKVEFFSLLNNQPMYTYSRQEEPSSGLTFLPDKNKLDSLRELIKQDYQKIESTTEGEFTILYFLFRNREKDTGCKLFMNTKTFVKQNLGPGIQAVARDVFTIQVVDKKEGRILYQAGEEPGFEMTNALSQDIWYLPGKVFRIQPQTTTIESLVTARSRKDYISLSILMLIVTIGFVFLISTIKKEVLLAEMKSEFVSNVSHEIRTPLALISMYAETLLLKRFKTPEKEKEYLTVIHNESNRLSEMVNRILSFSKMEKMKRQYHFDEVDINDLIDEVVYTFGPHLKSMSVECTKEFDFDLPLIEADREAVNECLVNLIDNAVKYGKETGKKIWIKTRQTDKNLCIDVEDNGIGISKKHLPYIFDKFYRVTKGNLAHQAKGTGIGLNIVQQIMKTHNGIVDVKSKPNEGSCFTLIFPLNRKKNG